MHELKKEAIQSIILTLKNIDVRGFDSMNRLVGLVMFFENLLNSQPVDEEKGEG